MREVDRILGLLYFVLCVGLTIFPPLYPHLSIDPILPYVVSVPGVYVGLRLAALAQRPANDQ